MTRPVCPSLHHRPSLDKPARQTAASTSQAQQMPRQAHICPLARTFNISLSASHLIFVRYHCTDLIRHILAFNLYQNLEPSFNKTSRLGEGEGFSDFDTPFLIRIPLWIRQYISFSARGHFCFPAAKQGRHYNKFWALIFWHHTRHGVPLDWIGFGGSKRTSGFHFLFLLLFVSPAATPPPLRVEHTTRIHPRDDTHFRQRLGDLAPRE